jgi:hypothetical protein
MTSARRRLHASLTLRQCLEQVAWLGQDYILLDQGKEWSSVGLLAALTQTRPDDLELPMYLRLPSVQQDGAICELTTSGGFILLYRICKRQSW